MNTASHGGWLARLERLGNRLPHPTLLFVGLCLLMLPLSALLAVTGVGAIHPVSGDAVAVRSLLDNDGLRYLFSNMVSNFTGFAPLGVVLVVMLGLGIAEQAGLLGATLASLVRRASPRTLVITVAFAAVMSSIAFDAGYVVLIPLAGLLFQLAGRSPLAGIATAFAGVSGGYSANLLLGPVDAVLAGLSTEAAHIVDADVSVSAAGNYWFIIASTVLVTALVSLVTVRITEPRLLREGGGGETDEQADIAPSLDRRALRWTLLVLALGVLAVAWLAIPADAPLRNAQTGGLLQSPFMSSLVVLIALLAGACGAVYGRVSGRFRSAGGVIEAMETTMASMAGYLVLMFFAAQFVAWFNYSQLGLVLAVKGAGWLGGLELPTVALLLLFVVLTALINLLIGSASAKWSILAPVFIPMLLLLGIAPEATQAAYRVGDSSTNIITPLMPYFALVLGFARRYRGDTGVGTLVALMLPYSLTLLLGWSILLGVWIGFGWPLGP
ncbi:aminobenzoyl-glutamate transporter [Alcanivorax sp. N3-2A]|nr:aminobenzoyl-glutamate transporter [Alcanivorax sp. N3-2A]|tara:strand:+ start:2956 stop:4449 length:1494 start_codon:yes stop_codon:yes gene_type:complete